MIDEENPEEIKKKEDKQQQKLVEKILDVHNNNLAPFKALSGI
jgi:hypothetical protein